MNRFVIILLLMLLFIALPYVSSFASGLDASGDDLIREQEEEFGIQDFLRNSKEYMGEAFENVDINDVLNDAH